MTQVLQKQGSIKKPYIGKNLESTKFVIIPWNPSGIHWILLAVNVDSRKLLRLDPMEQP